MYNCKFCKKECKNNNSLKQHEIRCKLNPQKIKVISNYIKYNEKIKSGEIINEYTNQYTKAKKLGLPKPELSEETRKKLSIASKNRRWTEEQKRKHSETMTRVAIENPKSYSAENVCGRTKLVEVLDGLNNVTKVNGNWEYLVAEYLNNNNIKWTNKIEELFKYYYNGQYRRYYPDFYLIDYDTYIEVKGYERPRDLLKWESVNKKLIILKLNEIKDIKNNKFDLFDLL